MRDWKPVLVNAQRAFERGDLQTCFAAVQPVLREVPYHSEANLLAGMALLRGNRAADAGAYLERARQAAPKDLRALTALGEVGFHLGDWASAKKWFCRVSELEPGIASGWLGVAIACRGLNDLDGAAGAARRALAYEPENLEALELAVTSLSSLGWAEDSMELLRPFLERRAGDAVVGQLAIFPLLYTRADPGPLTAVLKGLGSQLARACAPLAERFENTKDTERRLRIGYISREFHNRWAPRFIGPLIEHRNGASTEVFCYYQTVMEVERSAVRSSNATWRDTTGLDDLAFARLVRQDRIDVLVDMTGWIHGCRLAAFAHRAAPVQVTYLGFPATTGLPAMDYRIVDWVTDPAGSERNASEQLVRMPGCFVCPKPNHSPEVVDPPCSRTKQVTFGSFNSLVKIGAPVLKLWAEVVKAVPGSRLLIKNQSLGAEAARARVREFLEGLGVPDGRVELRGETEGEEEHLSAYGEVDVALDPYPYNGTTTTFDALWMGVPVVTLLGRSHVGRVTASMLRAAGYPEDVAGDEAMYVARCVELVSDVEALAERRRGQRERVRGSELCDGARFVGELEGAYREMWRRWCLGESGRAHSQ